MSVELRQWCPLCEAATVTYMCPYCNRVLCSDHEPADREGACPQCADPEEV